MRGETEDFTVKVSVYRGSALSLYLFWPVTNELTRGVQDETPWYTMFADDAVLVDGNANVLKGVFKRLRDLLEKN